MGNNNTVAGKITVRDCKFHSATSAAIRLMEPSRELQTPNVGKQLEMRGSAHHDVKIFRGSFSTQVVVDDCEIVQCAQALINWADWTHFQNSWITAFGPAMSKNMAVIENHDRRIRDHGQILVSRFDLRQRRNRKFWGDDHMVTTKGAY